MAAEDRSNPVPIAIIGMGCLFPKADGVESYWTNIQDGVDAITEVPPSHWRPDDYFDKDPKKPDHTYAARGGFLTPVDFPALELGISPNTLEAIDTTQLLGLLVAKQAFESAGYGAARDFDRSRVSVILGVTGTLELVVPLGARLGHPQWRKALKEAGVNGAVANDVVQRIADSYVSWQEDSFPGLLGNVVAGRIANRFDLGGTNCVVDAACASSLSALHLALLELTAGRSDMVLTGGMDAFNDIFMYMCFSKTPALSPTGQAKPFDADADGTILGEGLGCVLLKRLEDAQRDGDRIFAVIRSLGTSSDGKGQAIYAPSPAGQTKALRQAYSLAGVTPDSIELVEAHGTGTRAGDAAEVTALTEVYRSSSAAPWCALGSVKSQIGHTKAAAGVAGLIKAALALYHKVLPPTIKVKQPIELVAPHQTPFYVNTQKRPWMPPHSGHPRRAAVSAFGFGGSNFHCLLEEHGSQKETVETDSRVQVLAFSAPTPELLRQHLIAFPANFAWEDVRIEAARSRAAFRASNHCRLALVLERGKKEAAEQMAAALALLASAPDRDAANTPDGIYFAQGAAPGKLAMIFPGQGSQYVGMFRDLVCRYPAMHATLAEANASFGVLPKSQTGNEKPDHKQRLSDFIYPIPVFREADHRQHEEALRATDVAQPSLGAVSIGAVRILKSFNIRPEATAGHSYGELTALCAAGWIDEPALHTLSQLRGKLMAEGRGDRGGMLAVRAPLTTVESILDEDQLDLVLANRNAPNQAVLSGSSIEIARAREVFARRQIDCRLLPVAAAFHSRFVGDARAPFQEALEKVKIHPSAIPVFANSSANLYPPDPLQVRRLLAGQLAEPVDFVTQISNMHEAGIRTFLEVGPGNKLTGLVGAILDGRKHTAIAVDSSSGKRSGIAELARVLAQLAALGHAVDLSSWDVGQAQKQTKSERKPTLTVPICGANYVKPRTPVETVKNAVNHSPKSNSPAMKSPNKSGEPATEHAKSNGTVRHAPRTDAMPADLPSKAGLPKPMSDAMTAANHAIGATDGAVLKPSLAVTQEGLIALQRLGEQTAQLHRQFLEGQDRALQVLQTLLDQQHSLTLPVRQGSKEQEAAAEQLSPSPSVSLSPCLPMSPSLPVSLSPCLPVSQSPCLSPDRNGCFPETAAPDRNGTLPAPAAPVEDSRLGRILLEVVAGMTGYPAEMLELDMELDTDLGIDSIKRVEIFAVLQEKLPDAPPIKAEHMGTLRTLRQVVSFLSQGRQEEGRTTEHPATESEGTSAGPSPDLAQDRATAIFLDVVSEKTGYPAEMLQLDMELDTDLGIDSIKRVEIFSLLQEKLPDAPAVKAEHLGVLRTIRQVVKFLAPATDTNGTPLPRSQALPGEGLAANRNGTPVSGSPALVGNGSQSGVSRPELENKRVASKPTADSGPVAVAPLPAIPKEKRAGHGSALQRLVLSAVKLSDSARKPVLVSDGEIWITNEDPELAGRVARRLDLLGYCCRLISCNDLRNVTTPVLLAGLVILAPAGEVGDLFLQQAFQLLQVAAAGLRGAGKSGGSVFTTVSRLDGSFGLAGLGRRADPVTGGLSGLTKTAQHEWPEVRCKALDLSDEWEDLDDAAIGIVEEMFLAGPIEVGLSPQGRCSLQLDAMPFIESEPIALLNKGEVVVITGGARGVTAETAVTLAEAFSPTLILLGRSPAPNPEPSWLAPLTQGADIKRALLSQANGHAVPKELGERFQNLIANREMLRTIARIEAAGTKVHYRQVDVRAGEAVRDVLTEIRRDIGPIRGLVHGAGVLADRLIEGKTVEQFEMVYGTKAGGLQTFLHALKKDDLRVLGLFSSSTGRFGRTGQVDYAVANEVLNKLAQREARERPGCRVVSVNWGPWDGGMVNSSLKKIFASEGVGLIPLQQGAEFFMREIRQPAGHSVEVVVMADVPVDNEARTEADKEPHVSARAGLAIAFEREVTIKTLPVLKSHVIKGHAVLPMALSVELLAHGAIHANPGLVFHGFNDLRILKGIILPDDQPLKLRVIADKAIKEDFGYRVPVEMHTEGAGGRDVLHIRAEILLAARLPKPDGFAIEIETQAYPHNKTAIYNEILFHGPELQGIEHVEGCSEEGISASVASAPAPATWLQQPLRSCWLADPLVLDCAFQMLILWSNEHCGAASLPTSAGRYRQYRRSFPQAGVRVIARVTSRSAHRARADVDFLDRTGEIVARLNDYEFVIDASLNHAFRSNHLEVSGER